MLDTIYEIGFSINDDVQTIIKYLQTIPPDTQMVDCFRDEDNDEDDYTMVFKAKEHKE